MSDQTAVEAQVTARHLIEEIETANAPSRELDFKIWNHIGKTKPEQSDFNGKKNALKALGFGDALDQIIPSLAPKFTSDIGLILARTPPPGYPLWTATLKVVSHGQHGFSYKAQITVPSREAEGYSMTSLALALCAAVLRANEYFP